MGLYEELKARIQGRREPAAKVEAHRPEAEPKAEPSIVDGMKPGERSRYGPVHEVDFAALEAEAFKKWLLDDEDEANPRSLVDAFRAKY